jgi:hypothetical protein
MVEPVDVGLAPALAGHRAALQALLGDRYHVAAGVPAPAGVMIVDAREDVAALRLAHPELRVVVVFAAVDDPPPVMIIGRIEAGADVCLVGPSAAGLAAHVRALAAHRPAFEVPARAV